VTAPSVADTRHPPAPRGSRHVQPHGALATARHYVRELMYGSNDGLITTFAVVAGVSGGGLALSVVLVVGVANLIADGLSMAVGNYLSIRAHESVLEASRLPQEEAFPARHSAVTFVAFVVAGAVPLLPYALPLTTRPFRLSVALTLGMLFVVGASRAFVAPVRWWHGGLEMLGLGTAAAVAAYLSGVFVARLVG